MDGNVLTISLGSWMELPGLEFRAWEAAENAGVISSRDTRASVSSVARYYYDYVHKQGIDRFFHNGCVVTAVRPLDISHSQVCCMHVCMRAHTHTHTHTHTQTDRPLRTDVSDAYTACIREEGT
jgi:hypothetical protein